jgi:carboxypeptidase Taq
MPAFDNLLARLADISNLDQASAVLNWDQRTYMPPQGSPARARHLATLAKLAHEMFVARETQDLLAAAEGEAGKFPDGSDQRAMLRVARRNMDKATKVPTSLIIELTETCSLAEEIWQNAKAADDYKTFAPWLDKIYHLKRQYAAAIGYNKRIYDALLDDFEEGMTADALDPIFQTLRDFTVPFVARIKERAGRVTDDLLKLDYNEASQQTFSTRILKDCGFDFSKGRLDVSVHPFCTNFSPNDVRITTRYQRNWLPSALFGCLHEMGHALYEMNNNPAYEGTPLASGISLGVHESQSRLWENLVGRSKAFWSRYYPDLQKTFPAQLAAVPMDSFYRSINRVSPSLIRVEADEVTYNLHIILRYELEQDFLEQRLTAKDAPAAWNDKMQRYFGLTPPSDSQGILQDVHWSGGGIGYFPTYSLGNILAAQLFESAAAAIPNLQAEIQNASFAPLLNWLTTHVHQHGKKYPPQELVKRATGRPLATEPYLRYLNDKFSEVYGL